MNSPPHAADSDGSLLSVVSGSPPRPPPPKPRPRPTSTSEPKPKPVPTSTPASASTPRLLVAACSDPHGLTARIAPASALTATASTVSSSFRRFVQSRNLSFDPAAAFASSAPAPAPAEIPSAAPCPTPAAAGVPPQVRSKRVHPNSVSEVPAAAAAAEQPKRLRGGADGNFVRLNINGYGRRRTFRNSQARRSTKCRPFLQADIKVFLQSNSFAKFTPRAVARIMHGISSPAFPSATWGHYVEVDFPLVMEACCCWQRRIVLLVGIVRTTVLSGYLYILERLRVATKDGQTSNRGT